jgi:hypothetical protein
MDRSLGLRELGVERRNKIDHADGAQDVGVMFMLSVREENCSVCRCVPLVGVYVLNYELAETASYYETSRSDGHRVTASDRPEEPVNMDGHVHIWISVFHVYVDD